MDQQILEAIELQTTILKATLVEQQQQLMATADFYLLSIAIAVAYSMGLASAYIAIKAMIVKNIWT